MSEDRARAVLADHRGVGKAAQDARLISFEPGYRARQWVSNCVAVGMSGGFVEPLESTGIVVIEAAAAMIAEMFPFHGPVDASADRFNMLMTARYDNLVNFLKLHYCLSRRDETYWRENVDPASIPLPCKPCSIAGAIALRAVSTSSSMSKPFLSSTTNTSSTGWSIAPKLSVARQGRAMPARCLPVSAISAIRRSANCPPIGI
jgi:hypothetical protein